MGYIQNFGKFTKGQDKNAAVKLEEDALGARPQDPALATQYDQINNLKKQILSLQQQLQAAEQKFNTDSTAYSEKAKAAAASSAKVAAEAAAKAQQTTPTA
jgi:uncharacterized protein (DUF3084 family)